ncbi:MAG TPA: antitoxin AF2212-like protein [Tepidisphaeraceae bacterium]|jgi:predicted DNA-binding antitoxin AbrB/MazE fold protein|nr:antitoxin AF2212-like protein [Tepidisphaeraceae bacterium]
MTTLHARFDGKVLIPDGKVDLPEGELLELVVVHPSTGRSVAALRRFLSTPPQVTEEDVRELEAAIESAKLPLKDEDIFEDDR